MDHLQILFSIRSLKRLRMRESLRQVLCCHPLLIAYSLLHFRDSPFAISVALKKRQTVTLATPEKVNLMTPVCHLFKTKTHFSRNETPTCRKTTKLCCVTGKTLSLSGQGGIDLNLVVPLSPRLLTVYVGRNLSSTSIRLRERP